MSWLMALDSNHMNRGFRTITVPENAGVTLYEFRGQYGEVLSSNGIAPVVAEFSGGREVSNLDARIHMEASDGNMVIRYPASLDIRADITTPESVSDLDFVLADYMTKTETQGVSDGPIQYGTFDAGRNYIGISDIASKTNAMDINTEYEVLPLSENDTLQILAKGTSTYNNSNPGDNEVYSVNVDRKYKVKFVDEDGTVLETQTLSEGEMPEYSKGLPTKAPDDDYIYTFAGWTPELTAVTENAKYTVTYEKRARIYRAHSLSLEGDIAVNFYYNIPTNAYSGDLTIDFVYRGKEQPGELQKGSYGKYNYKATYRVAAKEMTEGITAIVRMDGEVIDDHAYTVKRYADQAVTYSGNTPELTTLVRSMLNYGGYAQVHFGYNMYALAYEGIDSELPELRAEDVVCPAFNKAEVDMALSPYGLSFYAANLALESETTLKLYFNVDDPTLFESSAPTVKIGNNVTTLKEKGDGIVYIEIPNIPAKKLGNPWTISVGEARFQYSAYRYIKNALSNDDPTLVNVVTALYYYGEAAKEYFNSL